MLKSWAASGLAPSLDLQFAAEGATDSRVTFSGGAGGTRVNSAGTVVAASCPRIDFDPVTLAVKGLLVEEQRTNSIRNSTMVGAVAGTPGTAPTNWTITFNGVTGLTSQIVAVGSEGGLTTIDLRISGTPSATVASGVQIFLEAVGTIAATAAQVWTPSVYASLIAGSFTNVTQPTFNLQTYTSVPALIQANTGNVTIGSGALVQNRVNVPITIAGASTASIRPALQFGVTSGAAVDFTVRIGGPQVELGAFATSFIPTTSAAVTRTADAASMTGTNFSSWWSGTSGTFAFDFDQAAAGSIAAVGDDTFANSLRFNNTNMARGAGGGFATQVLLGTSSTFGGASTRLAVAMAANDYAGVFNGGAVSTQNPASMVPASSVLGIGRDYGSTAFMNGHIKRLRYWRTRLPNATLQALTT